MKKAIFLSSFTLFFIGLFSISSHAQNNPATRPSPPDSTRGKVGNATIEIKYSSPSVRGRKIWGGLVPYGQVWRAGANEATTFTTDQPITVEGKQLPAGKYTLFATPGEKEWKFIFNSETGQWGIKRTGEANRDPAKDVLTVTATPHKSSSMSERLKYDITNKGMVLRWENLEVPVSIK